MNLSERIRSCLSSPKTAADVHSVIGGDLALIRGCIQTMVKVGLLQRIGESKPYLYCVARELRKELRGKHRMAVSKAQQMRDWLRDNGPATNAQLSKAMGITSREGSRAMSDMLMRGYVTRGDDSLYAFKCNPVPVQKMTAEQRREAERIKSQRKRDRLRRITAVAKPKRAPDKMTVVVKREPTKPEPVKAQTVEEWLAAGGKIDRSPTVNKFERLTDNDISQAIKRRPTSYATTAGRSYLAG